MISRRDLCGLTADLILGAVVALAQNAQRPVPPVNAEEVVVGVSVADEEGRHINDLTPSDFRLFEDDILQKIQTFTTKPLAGPKGGDNDKWYVITYYSDPSNHNQGYRIIKVEIVPDVDKKWTVRARPGYRPKKRTVE